MPAQTKPETKPEPKPAEPPPKKSVEMTPEEMEELQNNFIQRQFPGYTAPDKPEEPEPKPEPEAAKPAEEPKAEPGKAVEEPKPEPPKPAEEPKPEPVSPPLAEFKIPSPAPAEPAPAPKLSTEPEIKLSKREQMDLTILNKMAEMDARHHDLPDKYRAYLSSARAYIDDWMGKNPGKKFQAEDEEHREFFSNNYPDIDQDDFRLAEHETIKESVLKETKKATHEEIEKIRRESAVEKRQPEIVEIVNESVVAMAQRVDPELGKLVKGKLDDDTLKKMEEADPLTTNILAEEVEPLQIMVGELEKVALDSEHYTFDPKHVVHLKRSDRNFHPKSELGDFLIKYEQALLRAPAEKTAINGRRLVSAEDMAIQQERIDKSGLTAAEKRQALQELNDKYYTLTVDHYRAGLVAIYTNRARKRIEQTRKYIKGTNGNPPKPGEESQSPKPAPTATKVKSPDLASESDATDSLKKLSSDDQKFLDGVVKRAFGRV